MEYTREYDIVVTDDDELLTKLEARGYSIRQLPHGLFEASWFRGETDAVQVQDLPEPPSEGVGTGGV